MLEMLLVALVLFGVPLALFFVSVQISSAREEKRLRAWVDFGRRLQLTSGKGVTARELMGRFHLGRFSHGHAALYVFEGTRKGYPVTMFDFQYKTSRTASKSEWASTTTICLVGGSKPVANFYARPQDAVFDRLGKALGGEDLDFEGDPEFSKRWVLQGAERQLRALFGPRVREAFVRSRSIGVAEVVDGLLLVDPQRALEVEALEGLVDDAVALRELLEEHR
jgi:hypothetical protein